MYNNEENGFTEDNSLNKPDMVDESMENDPYKKLIKSLDTFTPLIPDVILDHFIEKAGVKQNDPRVKKMISLMTQKFITDVATNAFQYHKIFQKAAQKDKQFPKEKKVTLQFCDLEKAFEEMGIDISRPYYFT
ncbi:Transcription initiation factor TFIID subunit 10 [Astathelohania contejeani]|uniref:Transcription initiation factor TFIID subunit 10 n=1 Tax=Astathelohania contejeani TaxID=164912 RepID=A0ABQ7I224_9MICR|nr:Transcription initiation factor TFIID subunit 10 [Thelohania contejeani]